MEIYCTRPSCPRPPNFFADLDDQTKLRTIQQKFCTTCGMPLILAGRYIPERLLGRGGFGTAYLARDRYIPALRRCVVKQFQPAGDLSPQQLEIAQKLFEREAEVLAELGSANNQIPDLFAFFPVIIPGLQAGKEDQFFYLVQEFIDGKNLEEELAERGQFSEAEVLAILRSLLPVLQFVHDSGSIHRDIKPSNIMRDRHNGRLYLLDFGAVKQRVAQGVGVATPSTGIYSVGYAPTEQMRGGQVYPSTDLYALAVTCLVLLTSKDPMQLYDSQNDEWIWRSALPVGFAQSHVQVSDTLGTVLDQMLQFTPSKRFQSAEEVFNVLAPLFNPNAPTSPSVTVNRPPAPVQPVQSYPFPQPSPATSLPVSQPISNPVTPTPTPQPLAQRPTFSLLEILGDAAFVGFEGGLLLIALTSLFASPGISYGIFGALMGGLIFALYRRIVEGKDLPILIGITLAAVLFISALRDTSLLLALPIANPFIAVIVVGVMMAAAAIAIVSLFRLIYTLLSRFL